MLMSCWLLPANTKFYDVFAAFELTETYWPMNAKMSTGDTIYVYLTAPYKQVGFRCEVLGTGYDFERIRDQIAPFIKGEVGNDAHKKPFMKLGSTNKILLDGDSALSLGKLRENGLNGMLQGARKLENNLVLLTYIKDAFE